ncbi:MAG: hypothetical protein C0597_07880 [Marinilabiliales bacterium]|nr:MAG: hypothetical protein C0597_07880 [Marinilabiliales bacterium]
MSKYLFFIFFSFFYFQCTAQSGNANHTYIDKNDLENYIRILASDSLKGRYTGSVGQKKAAKFIAKKYSKIGLTPFYPDSYYEEFQLEECFWSEIYIRTNTKTLFNNKEISYLGKKEQNIEIELELVFGGYGTESELNQIDLKDKLVLVFTDNVRASFYINTKLYDSGAYGVVFANVDDVKQFGSIKDSQGKYLLRKRITFLEKNSIPKDKIEKFQEFVVSNNQIKNLTGISISRLNRFIQSKNINE